MKPSRTMYILWFLTVALAAASAFATPNPCQGAAESAACTGVCIARGRCESGRCVAVELASDGTLCASPNPCQVSSCQQGACVTSGPLQCPATDECHPGLCDPEFGCTVIDICTDLAKPTEDLAEPSVDLAQPSVDLAQPSVDLTQQSVDLAPPTVDVAQPNFDVAQPVGPDLGADLAPPGVDLASPLDLGARTDGSVVEPPPPHVYGSVVGCHLGDPQLAPTAGTAWCIALAIGAAARRRRR